jgi:DNA-binding LytR/AlgR family response regulator
LNRFQKAIEKAKNYLDMLSKGYSNRLETVENDYIFIKAERKIIKIYLNDITFIEGLKDYIVIHTQEQKVITLMSLKDIQIQLSDTVFVRVSKSYIVNIKHISSLDNNDIAIGKHEIPIGNAYRAQFFEQFISKKILNK